MSFPGSFLSERLFRRSFLQKLLDCDRLFGKPDDFVADSVRFLFDNAAHCGGVALDVAFDLGEHNIACGRHSITGAEENVCFAAFAGIVNGGTLGDVAGRGEEREEGKGGIIRKSIGSPGNKTKENVDLRVSGDSGVLVIECGGIMGMIRFDLGNAAGTVTCIDVSTTGDDEGSCCDNSRKEDGFFHFLFPFLFVLRRSGELSIESRVYFITKKVFFKSK